MNFNKRLRHLFIGLIVFFLLSAPFFQKVTSAQDREGTPTGVGRGPEINREWTANREREVGSVTNADAEFFSYLPLSILPPTSAQFSPCSGSRQEKNLAAMAKADPKQERPVMNCNPILSQVAHERAKDMAQNEYFSHTNLDGYGPNFLVSQAGYDLPDWWPDSPTVNYIESIAGGYPTADAAWEAWLNSASHRTHVLGQNDFWAEQINYGMGYIYIEGSPFGHYWVFITAPPEGN